MKERIFTTELMTSLKVLGAFAYKIPDMPHYKASKTRFDVPKPCDVVVGHYGYFIGIEAKMLKTPGPFGVKDMREAQIKGLNQMVEAGCDAYVFLNLRMPPGKYKKVHYPRLDKLLIFDWQSFGKLENNYTFEMLAYAKGVGKVTRNDKRVYDLEKFLSAYIPKLRFTLESR